MNNIKYLTDNNSYFNKYQKYKHKYLKLKKNQIAGMGLATLSRTALGVAAAVAPQRFEELFNVSLQQNISNYRLQYQPFIPETRQIQQQDFIPRLLQETRGINGPLEIYRSSSTSAEILLSQFTDLAGNTGIGPISPDNPIAQELFIKGIDLEHKQKYLQNKKLMYEYYNNALEDIPNLKKAFQKKIVILKNKCDYFISNLNKPELNLESIPKSSKSLEELVLSVNNKLEEKDRLSQLELYRLNECQQMLSEIQNMIYTMRILKKHKTKLLKISTEKKTQIEGLEQELQTKSDQLASIKSALEIKQDDNRQLLEKLATRISENKELTSQLQQIKEEYEKYKQEYSKAKFDQLLDTLKTNIDIETRFENLQELNRSLLEKIKKIGIELQEEKSSLQDTTTRLGQEIDSVKQEKSDLEQEKIALQGLNQTITDQLTTIKSQFKEEIERQEEINTNLGQQLASQTTIISDLELQLQTQTQLNQTEKDDLSSKLKKSKGEIEKVKESHKQKILGLTDKHKDKSDNLLSHLRKIIGINTNLKDELSRINTSLREKTSQFTSLQSFTTQLEATNTNLEATNRQLEDTNRQLEATNTQLQLDNTQLQNKIDQLKEWAKKTNKRNKLKIKKLKESKLTLENLNNDLKIKLQDQIDKYNKDIDKLNKSLLAITNESEFIKNELYQTKRKLKECNQKVSNYKSASSRLGNFYLNSKI